MAINEQDFVLDGDTAVDKTTGERRRLRGIDTGEISHTEDGQNMAGGQEAKARLDSLLQENPTAKWIETGRDTKWDRSVGYYEDDGGKDLNEILVREGYSQARDFKDEVSPYHSAARERTRDLEEGRGELVRVGTGGSIRDKEKPITMAQEFGRATKRGVDQTQGMLGYGLSALARAVGMDDLAGYGEDVAIKNFQEAQQHAATIGSYKDINFDDSVLGGLEDTARYVVGLIGEEVPQIGIDLAIAAGTGGLGVGATLALRKGLVEGAASHAFKKYGKAGLLSSMSTQQIGEVEAELQENGIDSPNTAIFGGMLGGLLDYTGARVLMKSAGDLAKAGKWSQANEVIKQGLKTTGLEGTTEALQEMTAKGAVLFHKSEYDMFSDENIESYVNAFLGGAIVGSAPSVVAGTVNTAISTLDKISNRNKESLGYKGTQTPESKVIVTEGIDANGNEVQVAEEAFMPDEKEEVLQRHAAQAQEGNLSNVTQREEEPASRVKERKAEGKKATENGDRVKDTDANLSKQFFGLVSGARKSMIVSQEEVNTLAKLHPDADLFKGLKATKTSDGEFILSAKEEETANVEEAAKDFEPQTVDFSSVLGGESAPKSNGVKPIDFGSVLDGEPDTNIEGTPEPESDIAAREKTLANNDEAVTEEAPKAEPAKDVSKDPKVDPTQVAEEDAITEEEVEKAEASFTDEGTLQNEQKDKIIIKGVAKYAADVGLDAAALNEGLKRTIAKGRMDKTDAEAMQSAVDEYEAEVKAVDKAERAEKKATDKTKATADKAIKDPFKNSAFAEALGDDAMNKKPVISEDEIAGTTVTMEDPYEGFDVEATTSDIISKFWQDSAVTNPAIEDPDNVAFYDAMVEGIEAAQQMLRNKMILEAKESHWKYLGFGSPYEFGAARKLARNSRLWTGKQGENIVETMMFFSQGDSRMPIYLPKALVSLNNSEVRYGTTLNERNYDARMIDFNAELLGFMAENGYEPESFPDAKDSTIHIAFRPAGRGARATLHMAELVQNKKSKITKNKTDVSTPEFMAIQHEQQLSDVLLKADKAANRAIEAIQKKGKDAIAKAQNETYYWAERHADLIETQQSEVEEFEYQLSQEESGVAGNLSEPVYDPARIDTLRDTKVNETEGGAKLLKGASPEAKAKAKRALESSTASSDVRVTHSGKEGSSSVISNVALRVKKLLEAAGIVSEVSVEVVASKTGSVAQVTLNADGTVTLTINKTKMEDIKNSNPEAYEHILAHEVGHIFVAETMHNVPEKVLEVLHADFRRARASKPAGHPYKKRNGVGFDEWLADQFAIAITTKGLSKNKVVVRDRKYFIDGKEVSKKEADSSSKPSTSRLSEPTRSFIHSVTATLKKIVNTMSAIFGVDRLSISTTGQAFMESMLRTGLGVETMTDSDFADSLAYMNSEFGGNRPRSRAEDRRNFVELKALGKKTDKVIESDYARDFTVGQNLNKTSDLGRGAINAFGTALTKSAKTVRSVLTDPSYIPRKSVQFFDFARKGAPMFYTSASELKGMGLRHIAAGYRRMFDKTTADSALWMTEVQAVLNKVSDGGMKSYLDGTGKLPDHINLFMIKFHRHLKKSMPTLGNIANFFPRAYDVKSIEEDREVFEKLLVAQAKAKGVKNFTIDNAKSATDSLLQGKGAISGIPDETAPVFGSDPFSNKARVLDFVSDAALRKEGFLRGDIDNVILNYVHNMAKRANFEKEFSGWSPIIDEDGAKNKGNQKRTANFVQQLFVSLPFQTDDGRPMTFEEKLEEFGAADIEFFQRNRKYFKIAKQNRWIREVVTKNEDGSEFKAWEYYDKNQRLREAGKGLDENDRHRYGKIVDAMEGRIGAEDLSPKVRDAMSTVVAYQNWLTLLFSGFSQLIEVSGVIFRNRDIEGAMDSLKEIGKLIMGEGASERRALFNDLGFAHKQLTQQALLESMGVNYQSATAQKMNDLLFKVNGMNHVTNASRVMGAAVAQRFIQRHVKKAANGNPRSERYLSELDLTIEQAEYLNSATYKPYSEFVRNGDLESAESLKAEAIHKAMFKFVDSAIVRPNASQRPVWGSDPRWMMIWHLKSFMYAYGSSVLGGLNSEIQNRFKESRPKGLTAAMGDASIPLMVYAIPVLLMSGLGLELREFIQYTVLGLGAKPYSDSLYGGDYMMELVSRGGMLGPLEMGYSIADDVVANERSSLMGWLSPTTSHLETILSFDADRIANRSIPFVSQNPALKQWFRELLN